MNTVKIFLGSLAIFAALTFNACDNNASHSETNGNENNTGEAGDSLNNMNNGGNYSPDERSDNREGENPADSNYGTTGSKFDANGNPVTGNTDVNSNRQQDATTGGASNTEKRKQDE